MIKWRPFNFENSEYDLTHLHPFEIEFKQQATIDKPEKCYLFEVCFSLHCFTYKDLGAADNHLLYSDARETRVFCFERYELSKNLPKIVRTIFERNCYHTGHSNYFNVGVSGLFQCFKVQSAQRFVKSLYPKCLPQHQAVRA